MRSGGRFSNNTSMRVHRTTRRPASGMMASSTPSKRGKHSRLDCRPRSTRRSPRPSSGFSECRTTTVTKDTRVAYRYLQVERTGSVEYLTLNRPDVRNAFNEDLIGELTEWAVSVTERFGPDRPRIVVLAGAGKVFCAGADVAWMGKTVHFTEEENLLDAAAAAGLFAALDALPVPVIGRVHGAALGGGAGLTAVCDIVVADRDAVFGFTEVKLGILPAVISPFVISKIGRSAARELFLTGARFSAMRAR